MLFFLTLLVYTVPHIMVFGAGPRGHTGRRAKLLLKPGGEWVGRDID